MTLFSGRTLDSDGDSNDEEEDSQDEDDEEEAVPKSKGRMKKSDTRRSLTRKESKEDKGEESDGEGESAAEYELCDATVKLLRLFANLSINESIGFALAKRRDSAKVPYLLK